jgi:uncharacterized protein with NRDE domain
MCLILIAWQAHPDYPLVVAANRDEFFARPAAAAAFWPEAPQVLAGRDLEAGGSWLGISREQRFAALTNYREGGRVATNARSRGALVADFLSGHASPSAYLAQVAARAVDYNGFNLFVADGQCLAYYANRGDSPPRFLSPGIYGLSNHLLDTPWPKLATAKASFAEALAELPAQAKFFESARRPGNRCRFTPAGDRRTARLGAHSLGGLRALRRLRDARVNAARPSPGRSDDLGRT